MKKVAVALFGASVFLSCAASAQTAVVPIAAPTTTNAVLRVGTEVPLKLSEALTTKGKKLKVGQRVHLETAENVMVQNVVVIPVGSPAMAEITDVRNQGMWGKSGHFGARVLYLTVNGRQVRLSGAFDDKGTAGGIGAVAASTVFLPAGFLIKGTNASMEVGAPVKGFIDEDVPLSLTSAAPQPLVIGAAAPTATGTPAIQAPAK
jgi:hypothetical protein